MTSRHVPLLVQAHLKTPVSIIDPIPLEGILYAMRFRRDPSTMGTPLDCLSYENGIPRASVGFMVDEGIPGVSPGETKVVRSLDLRQSEVFKIHLDGRPPSQTRIGDMSEYRPRLTSHPLLKGIPRFMFQAVGDRKGIELLLDDVPFLGKLRNRGYGHVTRWTVEEIDADPADCGWFAGGRVLRRLPEEMAIARLGNLPTGTSIREGRMDPPFWTEEGDEIRIASPTLRSCLMPSSEIYDLLAA